MKALIKLVANYDTLKFNKFSIKIENSVMFF